MRRFDRVLSRKAARGVGLALFLAVAPSGTTWGATPAIQSPEAVRLPVLFIARQQGAETAFVLRGDGLGAWFWAGGAFFQLASTQIGMHFPGANPAARPEGIDPLSGRVNFLLGNVPQRWSLGGAAHGGIIYRELYSGIDMVYRGSRGLLKSEFIVRPGGDPSSVRLAYSGIRSLRVTPDGGLVIQAADGELREEAPEAYQEFEGRRVAIPGRFRLAGNRVASFEMASYDRSRPLIIDPQISYSTYLGGSRFDAATAIAVDAAGNAYVAGWTESVDIPVRSPVQATQHGSVDAFIAKLDPAGGLVYCTYLGGGGDDRAFGLAVDGAGSAYLTGWTSSRDFPVMAALQSKLSGGRDAFVAKLSPSGSTLLYSTYLGGAGQDSGNAIAVDASGNAFIAGETMSANFPTYRAVQPSLGGGQDGFLVKLNALGGSLVYGTFLGGYGNDRATAVAVDSAGNAYVTGATDSTNFPVVSPLQASSRGGQDAFIAKLNASGSSWVYSTYLGGSGGTVGYPEAGFGIAVDAAGNAYVAGTTSSVDFPVANALQPNHAGGGNDAFLAKVNATGTGLTYSTYLGGSGLDVASAIRVDASGRACVAGWTSSSNFPVGGAVQTNNAGGYDAFVSCVDAAGSPLLYSTYLGGRGSDAANALALDSSGGAYLAGQTLSDNFPLKNAIQSVNYGGFGAFVAKLGGRIPRLAKIGTFRNGTFALDLNGNGTWEGNLGGDRAVDLGLPGSVPVVGDWNGDGKFEAGVFSNGTWRLDYNGDGVWDAGDISFTWGQAGDLPVVGDWNGSGRSKVGIFRNGYWMLDYDGDTIFNSVLDRAFIWGAPGDTAVIGDWNGDGRTEVGVYRNGYWTLDYNGNTAWEGPQGGDRFFMWGSTGDTPVVGDWNGDGKDEVGVYRGGLWTLDYNGNTIWEGPQGGDRFFMWGTVGDTAILGDWNGDGRIKVGVFSNGIWILDYNGNTVWEGPQGGDRYYFFGSSGDVPVIGPW